MWASSAHCRPAVDPTTSVRTRRNLIPDTADAPDGSTIDVVMNRKLFTVFALMALLAAASSTTVVAHHSQSQFEPELTISVEGTLTKASWANPHTPVSYTHLRAHETPEH